MANENNRSAAYRYNGAAAYDVYRNQAAPQIDRPSLPEERRRPAPRKRVKVKASVSPFALLGMAAAVCMMVLVIFGYVQLYEATSQVGKLESQLQSLRQEKTNLESTYEGKIDLAYIEQKAMELGMGQPGRDQVIYLNLTDSDKAQILTQERTSIVHEVISAIESSVSELVAYLS